MTQMRLADPDEALNIVERCSSICNQIPDQSVSEKYMAKCQIRTAQLLLNKVSLKGPIPSILIVHFTS